MTVPEETRTLAEDILARASEDWVSAAEVIDVARRSRLAIPDDLRDLAVGLITRLIVSGLVAPGDIDGTTHRPWPMSNAEAIARIIEDWSRRRDPFVMPGEIVWLDTTPEGQQIGESILERERA